MSLVSKHSAGQGRVDNNNADNNNDRPANSLLARAQWVTTLNHAPHPPPTPGSSFTNVFPLGQAQAPPALVAPPVITARGVACFGTGRSSTSPPALCALSQHSIHLISRPVIPSPRLIVHTNSLLSSRCLFYGLVPSCLSLHAPAREPCPSNRCRLLSIRLDRTQSHLNHFLFPRPQQHPQLRSDKYGSP